MQNRQEWRTWEYQRMTNVTQGRRLLYYVLTLSSAGYLEGLVAPSSSTSKIRKDLPWIWLVITSEYRVGITKKTSLFSGSSTLFLRKPEIQSQLPALLIKSLIIITCTKGVERRLLYTNNGGPARVTQSAKHCAIILCRDVKRLAYTASESGLQSYM